jgi:hypothetical protein
MNVHPHVVLQSSRLTDRMPDWKTEQFAGAGSRVNFSTLIFVACRSGVFSKLVVVDWRLRFGGQSRDCAE